jgi:hypothetical protein
MPVYKPYKLHSENRPPTEEPKPAYQQVPVETLQQPPPPPGPGMMMPPTALLPFPPPNMLTLYQIVPFGPKNKSPPPPPPPPESPPGGPLSTLPVPATTGGVPATKTKPRTVHEYYDQHGFQWREFNPEDTIVGDASDPFIVYFRYASKSIGARRTAFLLPKHAKLIKIMQDCLPDFDWRTGEDLLVYFMMVVLILD